MKNIHIKYLADLETCKNLAPKGSEYFTKISNRVVFYRCNKGVWEYYFQDENIAVWKETKNTNKWLKDHLQALPTAKNPKPSVRINSGDKIGIKHAITGYTVVEFIKIDKKTGTVLCKDKEGNFIEASKKQVVLID